MISHDLRTPLAAIMTSLELIGAGAYGELKERGQEMVGEAHSSVEMLLSLINEMLEIERFEAGALTLDCENTDLFAVLSRAADAVRPLADKQEIKIVLPDTTIEVYGDTERLIRVLINLLGNALKFTPRGSTITIGAGALPEMAKVTVTDQGRGIPSEYKDKIFDRFQQIDKTDATVKGGSGLGLAICKAIVTAHGGEIGVDSELGRGSTFWFTVPLKK
jgi:signal transduction histidine kinase